MTITWYGKMCVVIETTDGRAVFNPPAKNTGVRAPKGPFDLIFFSDPPPTKADWQNLVGETTVVIETPGEWDHGSFFVMALPSGTKKPEPNIFIVEQERRVIAHIAHYPYETLTEKDLAQIENVDILIISVGGEPNSEPEKNITAPIDAERAMKIANQIEPKIIIPVDFQTKGLEEKRNDVKTFLKETGSTGTEVQDKLTIKKSAALSEDGAEVVILKP